MVQIAFQMIFHWSYFVKDNKIVTSKPLVPSKSAITFTPLLFCRITILGASLSFARDNNTFVMAKSAPTKVENAALIITILKIELIMGILNEESAVTKGLLLICICCQFIILKIITKEVIYRNTKAKFSAIIALWIDSFFFNSLEVAPTTATPAKGNRTKIMEDHSPFMPFGKQLILDKEITEPPATTPLGEI